MKTCRECETEKPITEFYEIPNGRDGHRNECKECTKARNRRAYRADPAAKHARTRAWEAANPERRDYHFRRSHLQRTYNMSPEGYAAKLAEQGGVCAVCQEPPGKQHLAVDHDHACCPGVRSCGRCVRGLLCNTCNSGRGRVDDPVWLRRRADYVEFWVARMS
jgi:hypothetical protein